MGRKQLPLLGMCIGGLYGAASAWPVLGTCVFPPFMPGSNSPQCPFDLLGLFGLPTVLSATVIALLLGFFLKGGATIFFTAVACNIVIWGVAGGILHAMATTKTFTRALRKMGFGKSAIMEMKKEPRQQKR